MITMKQQIALLEAVCFGENIRPDSRRALAVLLYDLVPDLDLGWRDKVDFFIQVPFQYWD